LHFIFKRKALLNEAKSVLHTIAPTHS
jgi:high frequency lysogenization protein